MRNFVIKNKSGAVIGTGCCSKESDLVRRKGRLKDGQTLEVVGNCDDYIAKQRKSSAAYLAWKRKGPPPGVTRCGDDVERKQLSGIIDDLKKRIEELEKQKS